MKKLVNLKGVKTLSKMQQKSIYGGDLIREGDCPSGTAPCTCNGEDMGCKTVQGCWDSC